VTDVKVLVDAHNGTISPRIFADPEIYEQELARITPNPERGPPRLG